MIIKDQTFDEERALYNLKDSTVINCCFKGPKDGESVLKETRNIVVKDSSFSLRYPLWHAQKFELINSNLDELTRAPIWYSHNGIIDRTTVTGVKCLRECSSILVKNSTIDSKEFGWFCKDIEVIDSTINSEYLFMHTDNVKIKNLKMSGKYTFQYMNNLTIEDSYLDTKDAFWHSNDVTVINSVVKGEYLAWFSNRLTLINCRIIGTQPLCYCKELKLINCTMEDTDLAFEYSDVEADIKGNVISIKNPRSGHIYVDSVNEIVKENPVMECKGEIIIRESHQ